MLSVDDGHNGTVRCRARDSRSSSRRENEAGEVRYKSNGRPSDLSGLARQDMQA